MCSLPGICLALLLYFSVYVRLLCLPLLLFFASFYLLFYIYLLSYISIFITRSLLLVHVIWLSYFTYLLSFIIIIINIMYYSISFSILSPASPCFRSLSVLTPYSLYNLLLPKSLYFASPTHSKRHSKFHARECQRFLTVIQLTIPQGFLQKMIEKSSWKHRLTEIRDIFCC